MDELAKIREDRLKNLRDRLKEIQDLTAQGKKVEYQSVHNNPKISSLL